MLQSLARFADVVPQLQNYSVKTASREQVARGFLLESDGRSATVLLMASRNLYGIELLYWEPETIWLTLEKDGIDLPVEARDKLQGAITLIRNPAFYWDNLVFQRTVQSFNGELYDPEALQECHPAHMSWATYEASLIRGMDPEEQEVPEFDEDVQQYVAVCLKRAGYIYPPPYITFAAENLLKMLPEDKHAFAATVKKAWEHLDKEALQERSFPEDPQNVQLAKLASCYDYTTGQAESMANDVLSLEKGVNPLS